MSTALITTPLRHTTWDLDTAHSSLEFAVRHLGLSKVHGRFGRWSGTLRLDDAHPESSEAEVRIETASIDTHESARDTHLRSEEFFDAAHHPVITFRSTGIKAAGSEAFELLGDLTIAGTTRGIVLEVETLGRARDPWGAHRVGFSARTTIDRREFGLVWNQAIEAGGFLVGDKVEILVELEAIERSEVTPVPGA